jgi:hypothetical protein
LGLEGVIADHAARSQCEKFRFPVSTIAFDGGARLGREALRFVSTARIAFQPVKGRSRDVFSEGVADQSGNV